MTDRHNILAENTNLKVHNFFSVKARLKSIAHCILKHLMNIYLVKISSHLDDFLKFYQRFRVGQKSIHYIQGGTMCPPV